MWKSPVASRACSRAEARAPFRAGTRSRHPSRGGFTLLEVVVALAIIGIAGVAALETFGAEVRTADTARQALQAAALAQERLGRLALLATPELARLPDSLARGTFPVPFDAYGWQATSGVVTGERDLYEVAVAVAWDRGTYELRTRWYRPQPLLGSP
ncbi:MAG TPA: type II secretion system protein [Gemmatimonadales bacterium]|nr:type II secretion system protein [Gemmatimonadales bacterium]